LEHTLLQPQGYFYKHRFYFLLVALLVPFVLHPFAADAEFWGITLLDLAYGVIFLIGIFALNHQRKIAFLTLILIVVSQAMTWTNRFLPNQYLVLISTGINCLFLIYAALIILKRIMSRQDITSQTIMASLCVYLILGYIWAFIYSMFESIQPGSFYINHSLFADPPTNRQHLFSQLYYFFYFSFTTLTTLGFGDILPSSSWTRVLTSLEAMVGQLYLVVLVSRLVGMHIQDSRKKILEEGRQHGK